MPTYLQKQVSIPHKGGTKNNKGVQRKLGEEKE